MVDAVVVDWRLEKMGILLEPMDCQWVHWWTMNTADQRGRLSAMLAFWKQLFTWLASNQLNPLLSMS